MTPKQKKQKVNTKATIAAPPGSGIIVVRLEDGNIFVVSSELAGKLGRGLSSFSELSTPPIPAPNWPQ